MPQYGDMDQAIAGLVADTGQIRRSESWSAAEQIAFGDSLWAYKGGDIDSEKKVYKLKQDVAKIVFDIDFVSLNTIDLKVNGVAISQVTFSVDQLTTMTAVRDAVTALAGVDAAIDPADTNNRTLLIRTMTLDCVVTDVVVALGAGQAVGTVTQQTDQVFVGVATFIQKNTNTTNQSRYEINETVSALYRGIIWVNTAGAVSSEDDADVVQASGLWDSAGLAVNSFFRSSTSGAGLAKVEVQGQVKPFTEVTWV